MKFLKRFWWILVILIIAGGGGFLYFRYTQMQQVQAAAASFQTVKLAKGSIETTVSATGNVRASQSATVNWTLTGQVGKVLVQTGDTVKAGQVIASLSTANLPDTVVKAQADLVTDQQALEDLKSSKVDLASAQQAISTAQDALTTAQQKLAYLKAPIRGDQTSISLAQTSYEVAQNEYERTRAAYDSKANLDPSDPDRLNAALGLQKAQQARDKALADLNYLKGKATAEEIAAGEAAVTLAQAQLDDAQRSYDRQKSGPTEAEISAAQVKITADQEIIDSVNLRAPFDGVVTQVDAYNGEAVAKGDTAVRIDDLSGIYIDLSVSEVDINSVKNDQPAVITLDAAPEKTYNGKVVQVGLIGTTSSGTVNYPVTVKISDADQMVKTGMTASAAITTSSLEDILLVPTKSIKTVNNQKNVYVVRGGQVRPVAIQTGKTSETMTQIVSGSVQEGDQVLSNPTTAATTANRQQGFSIFGLLGGGGPGVRVPAGGAGGPPPDGGGAPPGGGAGGRPGG